MTDTRSDNVISIAEWLAKHQRNTDRPVVWTYYEVVPDPAAKHGWRLQEIERKPHLELE
jgi:hypothetical protein